ncbi:MAG: hypothetical protein DI537_05115 [Stutzerimonas stutzeri]|nr:MAG: hypothetical protein DI537_05115 [Stutzerimonas stutzeri]
MSRQLAPKSAIVAEEAASSPVFHYEGNVYNSVNLQRYVDRLTSAAGRLSANYPTSAMAAFNRAELVPVGTFNAEFNCITELVDADALERWSGENRLAFAGETLPTGYAPLSDQHERALQTARFLGRNSREFAYRTLAGQLVIISTLKPKLAHIRGVCEKWER